MKKIISILLIMAMSVAVFAGCSKDDVSSESKISSAKSSAAAITDSKPQDSTTIRIAGLKGATSIGMLQIMDNNDNSKAANKYEFTIAGAADEITPKLVKGELDMAAVPSNLASVLYNNTNGAVKVVAINTLGVTYIVEKGENIASVADLKGKTIYATGKGSVPEYSLRYILSKNNIDPDKDVKIEWKSEPTEVVALLKKSDSGACAMLPQPYVTAASAQVEGLKVAINLNDAWNAVESNAKLITGVMVVRSEFLAEHTDAVNTFLDEYKTSIDYVNANTEASATLCEKYDIVKAAVATKAIPFCNISYIDGAEMKTSLSGLYNILFEQNPKAVGGTLPADDFYYGK